MDNENKHVHISSPKGPEDASNIADEYPSPERTPATLSEHVSATDQQPQEEGSQHVQEQEHHHHQHEDTDMQTELANQVAAQAIEAAVAEVRAKVSSSTPNDIDMNLSQVEQQQQQQTTSSTVGSENDENQDHMQSHHIKNHHNPRQPTFPKSKSSLLSSYIPTTSSSNQQIRSSSSNSSSNRQQQQTPKLSERDQIAILREAYARNPNPGKKELENLAERTGRPWNKIREYFRQRRNKLRGLEDLENMEEPGRATGWLQVAYRQAPSTSSISQLSLYNSYKHRFDPYSITTPLLGGQELIQLACATFPGCEMAKDDNDYVLKGLKDKDKETEERAQGEQEEWEKGMEGLVEPLRAGSWLLSSFQHQTDPDAPSTLTQTDLYTSYAARFSTLLTNAGQSGTNDNNASQEQADQPTTTSQEEQDHEADMRAFEEAGLNSVNEVEEQQEGEQHESLASLALLPEPSSNTNQAQDQGSISVTPSPAPVLTQPVTQQRKKENRLLNPLELINLARMTFPKCEPMIDPSGRFVIKGLERRMGYEPGSKDREREMFNFALHNESKPGEAFVSLMKRKLGMLNPESTNTPNEGEGDDDQRNSKRLKGNDTGKDDQESSERTMSQSITMELNQEDKDLIQGLKRFRNSKLGEEVREVCISQ